MKTDDPAASIFAIPSGSGKSSPKKQSSSGKEKNAETKSKPIASIFQIKKATPKPEVEENDKISPADEEGEDELSDEEIQKQEGKAASKLYAQTVSYADGNSASIFVKNAKVTPDFTKGWKEGEP